MVAETLTFLVIVAIYAWLKDKIFPKKPKTDEEIAHEIFKKYKL